MRGGVIWLILGVVLLLVGIFGNDIYPSLEILFELVRASAGIAVCYGLASIFKSWRKPI